LAETKPSSEAQFDQTVGERNHWWWL